MKAKEIQVLIGFLAQSGLDEVNIETEQFKISVKKHSQAHPIIYQSVPVQMPTPQQAAPAAPQQAAPAASAPTQVAPKAASNLFTIKSPMIGTFYRSSSPDSPVFVNIGDDVKKGKTVCIIEAMKLFNEIESEVSGRIVKVLVENATPIEYDQPLFLVELV